MEEAFLQPNRLVVPGQSFFKYMPAATAKLVLENRTLRWSSPLLFNDPFDVPRKFASSVTAQELAGECARTMSELVRNPPEDASHLKPELQVIAAGMKKASQTERESMRAELENFARSFQAPTGGLSALRDLWDEWLPGLRILCLASRRDNAPLWAHYASNYSGVVIELVTRVDTDSPWLEARPVHYSRQKPRVYTAAGHAEIMMLPLPEACHTIMRTSTFTKSEDWSYEQEWRVVTHRRQGDTSLYCDYNFAPSELGSVLLGPNLSAADRSDIQALLRLYPDTRAVDVSIGFDREFTFRDGTSCE